MKIFKKKPKPTESKPIMAEIVPNNSPNLSMKPKDENEDIKAIIDLRKKEIDAKTQKFSKTTELAGKGTDLASKIVDYKNKGLDHKVKLSFIKETSKRTKQKIDRFYDAADKKIEKKADESRKLQEGAFNEIKNNRENEELTAIEKAQVNTRILEAMLKNKTNYEDVDLNMKNDSSSNPQNDPKLLGNEEDDIYTDNETF